MTIQSSLVISQSCGNLFVQFIENQSGAQNLDKTRQSPADDHGERDDEAAVGNEHARYAARQPERETEPEPFLIPFCFDGAMNVIPYPCQDKTEHDRMEKHDAHERITPRTEYGRIHVFFLKRRENGIPERHRCQADEEHRETGQETREDDFFHGGGVKDSLSRFLPNAEGVKLNEFFKWSHRPGLNR